MHLFSNKIGSLYKIESLFLLEKCLLHHVLLLLPLFHTLAPRNLNYCLHADSLKVSRLFLPYLSPSYCHFTIRKKHHCCIIGGRMHNNSVFGSYSISSFSRSACISFLASSIILGFNNKSTTVSAITLLPKPTT